MAQLTDPTVPAWLTPKPPEATPLERVEAVVPAAFTVDTSNGRPVTVARVKHTAYLYQGRYYRTTTAFDQHTVYAVDVDPDADWVPHPGLWFDELARQIEASAAVTA